MTFRTELGRAAISIDPAELAKDFDRSTVAQQLIDAWVQGHHDGEVSEAAAVRAITKAAGPRLDLQQATRLQLIGEGIERLVSRSGSGRGNGIPSGIKQLAAELVDRAKEIDGHSLQPSRQEPGPQGRSRRSAFAVVAEVLRAHGVACTERQIEDWAKAYRSSLKPR